MKKQQLNIVSVEDPVEINLPGITQICTNESFGFPQALRTILRQDPNVIMIGEIRDTETAKIALSAAQTGHLVIASVHAGNSFSALQRMHDLGVDTKELIPQLLLLTSQQLIRTTANHLDTSHEDYYQNRRGVFDVIACTPLIQQQLLAEQEKNNLAEFIADYLAKENDYSDSILMNLLKEGQTDWSELQRVYGWNKVAKLSAQYKSVAT